jgi:periplasmic protein TonB
MSTDAIVLTADRTHALSLAARTRRQPLFWIALVCAAIVHAAFIVGLARTSPRTVGDPNGNANAIDVELVDASELQSTGFASNSGQPPPTPAAPPVEPPQPEAAKPEEATPPAKAPQLKTTIAPQPEEPQATALPAPAEGPEPSKSVTKKESTTKAEPKPEAKPETRPETKAKPESKPQPKTAKSKPLDLSVPLSLAMRGTSGDDGPSSATRPPGITRSGENDRFGRDVIRALKKTMPQSYGTRGRVTIRIVLNERGNIEQLRMVQSAGNRELDDDVLFSARQAVYPFPPQHASVADRTFLVTYVYR